LDKIRQRGTELSSVWQRMPLGTGTFGECDAELYLLQRPRTLRISASPSTFPFMHRRAIAVLVIACFGSRISAQAAPADSLAVVATVAAFNAAMAAGDSARVVSVLAEDLLVIEGGVIETRAEYVAHHLAADIKASQTRTAEHTILKVSVTGSAAYVVTRTVTPPPAAGGTAGESAELMVLTRAVGGWRIRSVHWSSRRRRA
jgi:ketosteroid isomerase-like protein